MPLDEADLAKIGELMDARQKKQAEESEKATTKLVEGVVGKAIKALGLDDKLSALKTETEKKLEGLKPADPDPKPKDDPKEGERFEDSKAFKKLMADQDDLKKKLEAQTKLREEAEAQRQKDLLSNTVRDSLIAAGADASFVPVAMNHLVATGLIKLNDKGEAVFTVAEKWGNEDVPAAEGAKKWLNTSEGKRFMPPTGKQGTGDDIKRGGTGAGSGSAPRKQDGSLDWGALRQDMSLKPLENLSDD